MIITIIAPGQPETAEEYTLRAVGKPFTLTEGSTLEYVIDPDTLCPLCNNRTPVWFVAPASRAAMDPGSTVLKSASACAQCMNDAILQDVIVIAEVDPDSF